MCPKPDPTVLYAARVAGVSRLFRLGGAHAIAAMAYGTSSVPRVDRIVGPGNAYVAAAKALVAKDCAIDFFAGPSEIAVLSTTGKPAWIAADLIAQAEHDPHARAILITPRKALADAVSRAVERQVPRQGPAREALASHGGIIVTRNLEEAVALMQRLAPEHAVCDSDAVAARITRAGTVFVGSFSAQASGDYVTGSNHVLPTAGAAAARGGLSTADFVRISSVQRISSAGLRRIARRESRSQPPRDCRHTRTHCAFGYQKHRGRGHDEAIAPGRTRKSLRHLRACACTSTRIPPGARRGFSRHCMRSRGSARRSIPTTMPRARQRRRGWQSRWKKCF